MPFAPTGFAPIDYTIGGIRTELNDALLVALQIRPNLLAALSIGPFGGGGTGIGSAAQHTIHYWEQDRLNPRQVTDPTGSPITPGQPTALVADAHAARPSDAH